MFQSLFSTPRLNLERILGTNKKTLTGHSSKSLFISGLSSLTYTGSVLNGRLKLKISKTWIMGTLPSLLLWCLTSLDYVYFKSYIKNRYFMLKKWIDMVGQDYCYIYFKDLEGFCRLCKKFYVKNLGVTWTMKHATPRWNIFFKGWTYLYIFNFQIFIIYLFIKEFIFYWYMKI